MAVQCEAIARGHPGLGVANYVNLNGLRPVLLLGWHIFARDFRILYRRALLGFLWAAVPVLVLGGVAIAISRQLGLEDTSARFPYPVLVVAGLVLWGVFSDGLSLPERMCRRARPLLRDTVFPHDALVVACGCYMLTNLAIRLPLVAAVMLYFGVAASPWLPAGLALAAALGALGLSLGLLLAPVSIVYTDVRYAMPFLQGLLILLFPVFYLESVTGPMGDLVRANPFAALFISARDSIFATPHLSLGDAALSIALPIVLLAGSTAYFRRMVPRSVAYI